MKIYLFILLLFVSTGLFAQGIQTPQKITRQVQTGKAHLLRDNNAGGYYGDLRDSANMLMFEYLFTASQNEQMADDEYSEAIYFNILPDKTGKFILAGDDLKKAQAHFYKGCFCMDRGTHLIVSGKIRGARMSKTTWYINADVMVEVKNGDSQGLVNKKIKGYFKIIL